MSKFPSEQRTFQRRSSLHQARSSMLLTLLKESCKGPNQSYVAAVPDKPTLKKSQQMLCREKRTNQQSSGKRFHTRALKSHHKHHVDSQHRLEFAPLESASQKPNDANNNGASKDGTETRETVFTVDSQKTCDSLETCSIDDDHFVLIFPRRERGYVTIRAEDVKLLEPCGMLNDNLVDFMLKYIELYQVPLHLQGKVHFFNSFFFTRLHSSSSHSSSGGDIESLSRWTSGVEIFSKKFLFVPICMHLHWTLAIVCNPGNIWQWNSKSNDSSERPCILYFDSLGTYVFSRTCQRLLCSYLEMEWRKRHSQWKIDESRNAIPSCLEHMPIWNISAPQQKNDFDCGLFILHYVIRFLMEPPNGGNFTSRNALHVENWFTNEDIKVFREKMKQLIMDLADYHRNHPING